MNLLVKACGCRADYLIMASVVLLQYAFYIGSFLVAWRFLSETKKYLLKLKYKYFGSRRKPESSLNKEDDKS